MGEQYPQFGEAVAFGLHYFAECFFHFAVGAVVEKHIHTQLSHFDPIGYIACIKDNFDLVSFYKIDNARHFGAVDMRCKCKKAGRSACFQLVGFVDTSGAFYDHKCFFADGKARLYDSERIPGIALFDPFCQWAFLYLLHKLPEILCFFLLEEREQLFKMLHL